MTNEVAYPPKPWVVGQEHVVGLVTKVYVGNDVWKNKSAGHHERRIGELEDQVNGIEVAEAVSLKNIRNMVGARFFLTDRNAWFTVVLTSTVTPNTRSVILCEDTTCSLKFDTLNNWVTPRNLGHITGQDASDVFEFMESATIPWILLEPEVYQSTGTVNFKDKKVIGYGYTKSRIENTSGDADTPAVTLQGRTVALDFQAGFVESDLTGTEFQGKRIAFLLGGDLALQRTRIAVQANFCGTGFASLQSLEGTLNNTVFSVTFDYLQAQNFTFRGIDFDTITRTGNNYANIFCQTEDDKKHVAPYDSIDCGIRLAGLENECTLGQLNVERIKTVRCFEFDGVYGLSGGSLHTEDVDLTSNYNGLVKLNNVSGRIDVVSAINLDINTAGWHILDCRDTTYDNSAAREEMTLEVGSLHAKRLNRTTGVNGLTDFNFIRRAPASTGTFKLSIASFAWQTAAADTAVYTAFPTADNNMKLTLGWAQPSLVQAFAEVITAPATTATVTFARPQPDLNYKIAMSSSLDRNYWWSNKSVNGFDVNFDTAPLTTGTIEGLIVRED